MPSMNLLPTTSRKPWCAVVVTSFAFAQAISAADQVPFPGAFAFNLGTLTKKAEDEAVKRLVAEKVREDTSRTVIKHLRIEIFENSKLATKSQTTVFAMCESSFAVTLNSGRQLTDVTVEYVILDSSGNPVGKRSSRIEYKESVGKDKKLVWLRTDSEGPDLGDFHSRLPGWAKEKLWQLSGFLSLNPGQQPVQFQKTDGEFAVGLVGEILDLAPGVAKRAVSVVLENVLKRITKDGLTDAVKQNEVRWGASVDITNERAIKNAQAYKDEGKKMWKK
jgi:hypothetical protein